MLGFPCNCTVTTLVGLFKCRALSGCCVATSLVACPGLSSAWELILLGGGGGVGLGATCSSSAWSQTWQSFYSFTVKSSVDNAHMWEPSSNQPGWLDRCTLVPFHSILFCSVLFCSVPFHSIPFLSVLFCSILFYSILFYSILFYSILFYSILFYCIVFYCILFYSILSPLDTVVVVRTSVWV